MLERISAGELPAKPHTVFRTAAGERTYEECLTRGGFEGPYSILYHLHRPHEAMPVETTAGFPVPVGGAAEAGADLRRRRFHCLGLPGPRRDAGGRGADATPLDGRVPLLFNGDVVIGFVQATRAASTYFVNADADELFFIWRGGGTLRSVFGALPFRQGDYVCVPKGTIHRFMPDAALAQAWLSIECKRGLDLPRHYRNGAGQLRMDAPYGHRDFRHPRLEAIGAADGPRDILVKRGDRFFGFRSPHDPLDVVGWDGAVYPFAFPILSFSPRVGQVHLPPSVHATFEAGGALICSFVPRPLDFHPAANPCPYPHASVDVDEVLFYANDGFASRPGVGGGSLSLHPAGIPHGPHPGAYELAPGGTHTGELAVMLDCSAPLTSTVAARSIEDPDYHQSFAEAR
jgi:homogentisate 1,2-dioxygenase